MVLTNSSFCPPASKNFQYNCIYLWSWGRTAAQRPDKKNRLVSAVVLAELQWTNTDVPYLSLSTCPGEFGLTNHRKPNDSSVYNQLVDHLSSPQTYFLLR